MLSAKNLQTIGLTSLYRMIGGVLMNFDLRIIESLEVSEATINAARSLTEIRGVGLSLTGGFTMDEILACVELGNHSTLNIATLSKKTVIDSGAAHLGFEGYFVFEASDLPERQGITVLAKTPSLDAAFRLADLWSHKGLVA